MDNKEYQEPIDELSLKDENLYIIKTIAKALGLFVVICVGILVSVFCFMFIQQVILALLNR
jgi:hypothetical protein